MGVASVLQDGWVIDVIEGAPKGPLDQNAQSSKISCCYLKNIYIELSW